MPVLARHPGPDPGASEMARELTDPDSGVRMKAVEEVAERFLAEDLSRGMGGFQAEDRARFHRLVRQCAANWLLHPQAGLRTSRTKHTATLGFEGPLGGKTVSVFVLRAHYDEGVYRFIGPNPDRKKLQLQPRCLLALDRLLELYGALLTAKEPMKDAVCATLRGDRLPDLVPLVEETRRALDGGQESSPTLPALPKPLAKKPAAMPLESSRPAGAAAALAAARARGAHASLPARPSTPRAFAAVPRPGPTLLLDSTPAPRKASVTVSHLLLSCQDVKRSGEFYAKLLKLKPVRSPEDKRVLDLEVGALRLRLQPDFDKDERKRLGLGPAPKQRGFGMVLKLQVADHAACLKRAKAMRRLVHEDAAARSFCVRDPSGYLLEIRPQA
jgi:catechol 2,3-dioxygenase-like lactoylglutathione lyase family enzyme